jgi:hypothetical protein
MICQKIDCYSKVTDIAETWCGSVPIYYKVCKKHKVELEKPENW